MRLNYRELTLFDWLLLSLAAAIILGCAGEDGNGNGNPSPSPSGSADAATISFPSLSFTHTVGVTSCNDGPGLGQQIGTVTIQNLTDTMVTVSTSGPANIVFDPMSTTAPPAGMASVRVFFDCGTTSSFSGQATISTTNGVQSNSQSATVTANIL